MCGLTVNTKIAQLWEMGLCSTHACDHITQHINNLDNHTQQNTLYTMEEDASFFTSNTATPCDNNITTGV